MHRTTIVAGVLAASAAALAGAQSRTPPKPSMSVRVAPAMAFTPARLVATAELKNVGQADASFYCPALEWDWGDGTRSEERPNCDPFEEGVSQVRTRYVKQNTYNSAGRFRVTLRLKQGKDVVLAGSTEVTIREGGGYPGPPE
jgi:hypothetical protein